MRPLHSRAAALTCATAMATASLSLGAPPTAASTPLATTPVAASVAGVATGDHPGLARLLATGSPTGRAIATFDARPPADLLARVEALGLDVAALDALPMAIVSGPTDALAALVERGLAADVYPDEVLQYDDTASTDTMSSTIGAAQRLRARGLTGKGVTVGVVDSGCDGTHPDLAERIVHNVVLVSPEYVNGPTEPVVAVPATNTDLGSGHGTHVAGIIAADGSTGADHLGVAPDADLACFAIGAVITTTAVVTAFDHVLAQPGQLGIDVINNSWGNSFRQYDPADPVNVATKALARKGIVNVFAAGNSGYEDGEASVSPFNQAPWVISVAAGDLDRRRGDFSSNGLRFDNSRPTAIGADGHTVHEGDRIGTTQPDVMAPGVDISSTCDSTGSVIGPCPPGENASASGTSMASPHVAGAVAVLLQANPRLGVRQVQKALKATATPVLRDGKRLGSWQVGYGHVNLDRAVALVTGRGWAEDLRVAARKADRRLQRQDRWTVARADLWQEAAPPVAVGGSYTATRTVRVDRRTDALKVALVHPTPGTAANLASVVATVTDASGEVVGRTRTSIGYSTGIAHVLVRGVDPGRHTIEVVGEYMASDPDTVDSDSVNGRVIFLQAAQLRRR